MAFEEIARRSKTWSRFKRDPSRTPEVAARFPRAFELCGNFDDVLAFENLRTEIGDKDFEFYLDIECKDVEVDGSTTLSTSTSLSMSAFEAQQFHPWT